MKRLLVFIIILSCFAQVKSQVVSVPITPLTPGKLLESIIISDSVRIANPLGKPEACVIVANDNFAAAANLPIGAIVAGSTCGSLQPGETTACMSGFPGVTSVWYKFTATAPIMYVQLDITGGFCYFGSAIYSNTSLPTSNCGNNGPISCQSASGGPVTTLYQLTNLTIGAVYYVQVLYSPGGGCGTNATFNIQVSVANPGVVTNGPALNNCAAPLPGCFFNSPPTVAAVTAGCPSYPLGASGYNANSVWQAVMQFTSSGSWSNFSWQAIIQSNCPPGGNVAWFNWTLYDCSCNQLACGDINTLTGNGLACGTCYRILYQMELANCGSFTTIWPFQNVPASPIPCTVLPLELLSFNAYPNSDTKKVNVEWISASENELKEYRLYKTNDGINFNQLATVKAKGNKNGGNQKYNYEDDCCRVQETRYYKLMAIDNDGKISFEKIIAVTMNAGKELIRFAPNPAQDNFVIIFGENAKNVDTQISIMNSYGEVVKVENFISDKYSKQINIEDLPSGIYFINVITQASEEVIKYKLVKQ